MKNELIRLRSIYEEKNNSALRGLDFKIYKGEVVESSEDSIPEKHCFWKSLREIVSRIGVSDLFAERCAAGRKYRTILKCAI